jgi:hypothetical protein
MQMISGKIIFFPVFGYILENNPENILQYLIPRKMKKKTQSETTANHRNSTINHRNSTVKPPQTHTMTAN